MDSKNYTEVLIDGKIYTLGGDEDEGYMQKVASYINEKTVLLKRQPGFTRQGVDYQTVMVELNIADDYFKAYDQISVLERQKAEMEKEIYSLKHELVSTQMKLDAAVKERRTLEKKLEEALKKEKEAEKTLARRKKAGTALEKSSVSEPEEQPDDGNDRIVMEKVMESEEILIRAAADGSLEEYIDPDQDEPSAEESAAGAESAVSAESSAMTGENGKTEQDESTGKPAGSGRASRSSSRRSRSK